MIKFPHRIDFPPCDTLGSRILKFKEQFIILEENHLSVQSRWIADEPNKSFEELKEMSEAEVSTIPENKRYRESRWTAERDYFGMVCIHWSPYSHCYVISFGADSDQQFFIKDEKFAYEVYETLREYFFNIESI